MSLNTWGMYCCFELSLRLVFIPEQGVSPIYAVAKRIRYNMKYKGVMSACSTLAMTESLLQNKAATFKRQTQILTYKSS